MDAGYALFHKPTPHFIANMMKTWKLSGCSLAQYRKGALTDTRTPSQSLHAYPYFYLKSSLTKCLTHIGHTYIHNYNGVTHA
jgi:hypothetical protein